MVLPLPRSLPTEGGTSCSSRELLLRGGSRQSHGQESRLGQGTPFLIQLSHEGKYIVNLDKSVKIEDVKPNLRVAVRSDNYILHKVLPTKVDPLISLMKVSFQSFRLKKSQILPTT